MTPKLGIQRTPIATYRRHTIHVEFAPRDAIFYRIQTGGIFDVRHFVTIAAACSAAKEG